MSVLYYVLSLSFMLFCGPMSIVKLMLISSSPAAAGPRPNMVSPALHDSCYSVLYSGPVVVRVLRRFWRKS